MIFVTLGSQKFQLNRLLRQLDESLKLQGVMWTEDIFAQIGAADYVPERYPCKHFLDRKEFETKVQKSDLILTHAGVGTIITALSMKKKVLVYPRLKKYQEAVDDHQLSIADAFSKNNYLMVCKESDDLWEKIEECRRHEFTPYVSNRDKVIQVIEDFLKGK